MVGGNSSRTNVLENFFILSRGNQNGVPTWFGVGYAVTTNAPPGPLYSLYRFATNHPVAAVNPALHFHQRFQFSRQRRRRQPFDGRRGVPTVRAYDVNGYRMTNNYQSTAANGSRTKTSFYWRRFTAKSDSSCSATRCRPPSRSKWACWKTARCSAPNRCPICSRRQLSGRVAGEVHVFRQRVSIPNVDPAAYQ